MKEKICFCIGPEKCNDVTCHVVKRYNSMRGIYYI